VVYPRKTEKETLTKDVFNSKIQTERVKNLNEELLAENKGLSQVLNEFSQNEPFSDMSRQSSIKSARYNFFHLTKF
jgi:hypothetical protein